MYYLNMYGALHGEVCVHVPHNMSVIHNMFTFAEFGNSTVFGNQRFDLCSFCECQHFVDNREGHQHVLLSPQPHLFNSGPTFF